MNDELDGKISPNPNIELTRKLCHYYPNFIILFVSKCSRTNYLLGLTFGIDKPNYNMPSLFKILQQKKACTPNIFSKVNNQYRTGDETAGFNDSYFHFQRTNINNSAVEANSKYTRFDSTTDLYMDAGLVHNSEHAL